MSTRSILLIEHEGGLREVLYACLKELGGWSVTLSSSIAEGIDQCQLTRPDAILLDASTSETDALIFLEQLKQHSIIHAIPILLMTARVSWLAPEQLHQLGFAGAVAKPFNPTTLPQQIAHLLGWQDEQTPTQINLTKENRMSTLTVWKFNTVDGADKALEKLEGLQKQQLIQVLDAAIVSWPQGRSKPKTYQAMNTVGAGALGGAFWGMLFGLIFFVPLFGMLVGAAAGALSGKFTDYGIDDSFITDLQSKVTEGTSALFLLTGQVTLDKVEAAFTADEKGELIQSNLSSEQEAKLREDFGAEV